MVCGKKIAFKWEGSLRFAVANIGEMPDTKLDRAGR